MSPLFVYAVFVTFILFLWLAAACADLTLEQLREIMPRAGDPLFWDKMNALDQVSFEKHMWTLIIGGDPYKLYDPIIFEARK